MRVSELNGYWAFDWPKGTDVSIDDLWRRFPELVLGRYLVNTSFDSGHFTPSPADQSDGWHLVGSLAHSPRIRNIEQIPHDQFDEWLVFEHPAQVSAFETMVNYCDFSPIKFWEEKRDKFWQQIVQLQPLHVLGENYGTYLVTRDRELGEKIVRAEPCADPNAGISAD